MRLRPFFAALALTAATGAALAHHPGSHAVREKDGRVRLDVAATAPETCAAVAGIRNVTPPRVASPPGGAPVTVQLSRKPGACSPAPTLVRHEGFLDIAEGVRLLHLYVVGADGAVLATERVPLR
jgi:hypothetical protein